MQQHTQIFLEYTLPRLLVYDGVAMLAMLAVASLSSLGAHQHHDNVAYGGKGIIKSIHIRLS